MTWNKEESEKATNGTASENWQGNKLSIDTRKFDKGDIFVALKGENTDGHNFIDKAIENGASSVIVSQKITQNIPYLLVKDTYKAIDDLAIYRNNELCAAKIAVTGSVGKTSTKEMLNFVFSSFGKTYVNPGNYNNRLGMPISLASMDKNCDFGIFELGMNHAGEIEPLSQMLIPDIAIITIIAPVHLEFFESIEGIARAKAEIFSGMEKGRRVILNSDSECFDLLKKLALEKKLEVFACGKNSESKIIKITELEDGKAKIMANIIGKEIEYEMNTNAEHLINNSILVLTAAASIGKDIKQASSALKMFGALKGRGMKTPCNLSGKNIIIIDDSYNASSVSVKAALDNLGKYKTRKIAILADMRELGKDSIAYHLDLKTSLIKNKIDILITYGELMQNLHNDYEGKKYHFKNLEEIFENLKKIIDDKDIILIKGSYGTKLHELVSMIGI